jgi:hypothetical protein
MYLNFIANFQEDPLEGFPLLLPDNSPILHFNQPVGP